MIYFKYLVTLFIKMDFAISVMRRTVSFVIFSYKTFKNFTVTKMI